MWSTQHLRKRSVHLNHDVFATIIGCGLRFARIFDRYRPHEYWPWGCQVRCLTVDGFVLSQFPGQALQPLTSDHIADQYTNWEEKIVVKPNGKRVIMDRDLSIDKIYHA